MSIRRILFVSVSESKFSSKQEGHTKGYDVKITQKYPYPAMNHINLPFARCIKDVYPIKFNYHETDLRQIGASYPPNVGQVI